EGGVEASGAGFLPAYRQTIETGDGFALKRRGPPGIERGDDPAMGQGSSIDPALAFADEQLKPGAAIFGRADRDRVGAEDRDVAAVAAAVEDAKAPPLARPEIERVLDGRAEPGGLDRKGLVALVARRRRGALTG